MCEFDDDDVRAGVGVVAGSSLCLNTEDMIIDVSAKSFILSFIDKIGNEVKASSSSSGSRPSLLYL